MNHIKKYCLLPLFVLLTAALYAQNIDSLLMARKAATTQLEKYTIEMALVKAYGNAWQLEEAKTHLDKAIILAKSMKDKELLAETFYLAGRVLAFNGEHEKGDSLYAKGLKYAKDRELKANLYSGRFECLVRTGGIEKGKIYLDKMREMIGNDTTSVLMGIYYFNYANYYGEQHQVLKNIQYLQKAKNIFLKHNQDVQTINHNLTTVFEELKAYEKALEEQKELREIARKNNQPKSELFTLYGMMTSYLGLEDYEATKRTCYESIELRKNKNVSEAFGYVYYVLGYAHLKTKQLDSAEYYFKAGIAISEKQNEAKELGDNHSGMAELMYEKGELEKAKYHAKRTRELITYISVENNSLLAKIHAKEGNYKEAYDLLRINWEDWEKREAERTDYQVISALLEDKYQQEKEQEQLIFKQKAAQQRGFMIGGLLLFGLILLGLFSLFQIKNNKKLKKLNQQLIQQNNTLQQFSYIASHDIKEPIRSIGNHIGLINRLLSKDDQTRLSQYFVTIKESTAQIYTLIEDVMQYTQVSQENEIKLKKVNLNEVIKNIEVGLSDFIQSVGGQVHYADLPTLKSSSSILYIVLKNLIQNGLKFNNTNTPTINITGEIIKDKYILTVSDNGIGIDKQYHEKIFEMFKRLHNRFEYEGSGIGLAIAKLSIEKLGGTISLESEVGQGSRFVIELPMV